MQPLNISVDTGFQDEHPWPDCATDFLTRPDTPAMDKGGLTVKQMIEALKKFPEDTPICVSHIDQIGVSRIISVNDNHNYGNDNDGAIIMFDHTESQLELIKQSVVLSIQDIVRMNNVLTEVGKERIRQEKKWGQQNHCPWRWLAILAEEFGEANKAVLDASVLENKKLVIKDVQKLKYGKGSYREELIQVAAVAAAMVECLDRGEWN